MDVSQRYRLAQKLTFALLKLTVGEFTNICRSMPMQNDISGGGGIVESACLSVLGSVFVQNTSNLCRELLLQFCFNCLIINAHTLIILY